MVSDGLGTRVQVIYSLCNAIELKVLAKHPHKRDPLGSETGIVHVDLKDLCLETAGVKRLVNGMTTEKGTEL